MKFVVALCFALIILAARDTPAESNGSPHRTPNEPRIAVGWQDELNNPSKWQPLGLENAADVFAERPGAVTLRLPHVPVGWPYTYQWSGITRTAVVDLGRYPVLVACVTKVQRNSYAHLDVEERDYFGKPVRIERTSTLVEPGLSVLDCGDIWGRDVRRLTLRLIVGGANEGASCEYAYVRFVRREDLPYLHRHPLTQNVVLKP
jgi:hypothetical protein